MKYIRRELERKFLHMNDFFKAVLVTGARQVGKTTMLKHLCEGHPRQYDGAYIGANRSRFVFPDL